MTKDKEPVTPKKPNTKFNTSGTDHITLIGSNEEDTIEYYRDILGMPLVLRQPNLDDPSQTHLFFDTGDGRILTFFVNDDRPSNPNPQRTGIGGVHHLAFKVEPEDYEEIMNSLEENGYTYNIFDRGIFHSIYTTDNNGLVIELSADKFEIPIERKPEILAKAQELREKDGSEYAKEKHLEQALKELDIEVKKNDLPEANSGVGGL